MTLTIETRINTVGNCINVWILGLRIYMNEIEPKIKIYAFIFLTKSYFLVQMKNMTRCDMKPILLLL